MKTFLQFIDKKQNRIHINEDIDRFFEGLPCNIDVTSDTSPDDDPKLDDFLKSLMAFIENWTYDWKIKHPDD
jgi:hypothetical protein